MKTFEFKKSEPPRPVKEAGSLSPAMAGAPFTDCEFSGWLNNAEKMPAISFEESKRNWAQKKAQLQAIIK
jgi:hypothetical protein